MNLRVYHAAPLITTTFVPNVHAGWHQLRNGVGDIVNCVKIRHPPTVNDVKFYIFTSKNKNDPERIENFNLSNTQFFNSSLDIKILIHGYGQSYRNERINRMKDVYLNRSAVNIIMVDWEFLSRAFCYPIVVDYMGFVGQLTGYLLAKLPLEKVHIIGFSLGAHVAGVGAQMQNSSLLRITGLDPAGSPLFKPSGGLQLNKSNAQNVDVIHTSLACCSNPIGHADFFVNGGKVQPLCSSTNVSCSHRRSIELYIESITSTTGFKAVMCDSFNNFESNKCANNSHTFMGEPWLSRGAKRGVFYLKTNAAKPYALTERPKT
ncbi:hypothetical protein FQA39_LY10436 [Lamprigera yunnana]|nr:hypothetical protein FQA39_LY10436 [Lamprigera yunnana]